MKLLNPIDVKNAKDAQISKDILRTESTKKALHDTSQALDDTNAKFELALANQRLRWSKDEAEAVGRIDSLNVEIAGLEEKKRILLIPIDDLNKKSYNLFKSAEDTFAEARKKLHEVEQLKQENEATEQALVEKLDSLSDREEDFRLREQKLKVDQLNVREQWDLIQSMTKDLLTKLDDVKHNKL